MVSTADTVAPPELWDIDMVTTYLGTGRRFVYRITQERRIRYLKIGGALRFDPADVAAFVEREKSRNDPAPAGPPAARTGRPRRR
jgi:excisionase family DNA binding protein